MVVFDKYWFAEKQRPILNLVNAKNPFVRMKAREILCLTDIEDNIIISKITPNSYHYRIDEKYFVGDFRTHNKFTKRMLYGFEPLWKVLHTWDIYVANQLFKGKLNFGFDTVLTYYPQAGGGGSNVSCDGKAYYFNASGGTWSTARSTCSGAEVVATEGNLTLIRCDGNTNKWDVLVRGFKSFDISSWSGTITSAYLGIKSWDNAAYGTDTLGSQSISFVESTQTNANTVATGDYTKYNTTKLATDYPFLSLTRNTYEIINLNSAGIAYVSGTTVPMFCILITSDLANTEPAWGDAKEAIWNAYNADSIGSSSDPKLVLTYTSPITFIPQIVIM